MTCGRKLVKAVDVRCEYICPFQRHLGKYRGFAVTGPPNIFRLYNNFHFLMVRQCSKHLSLLLILMSLHKNKKCCESQHLDF